MIEHSETPVENPDLNTDKNDYIERVKRDLWIALVSREASLLGRKEVLTGKAKFGILTKCAVPK